MNEFEKGFIVGLIEGEGTFQISKQKLRNSHVYKPRLKVSNTNHRLLESAQAIIGGHISISQKATKRRKTAYALLLLGRDNLLRLLTELNGSWIGKAESAAILQQFLISRAQQIKEAGCTSKASYTAEEIQFYEEIKAANKRGRR